MFNLFQLTHIFVRLLTFRSSRFCSRRLRVWRLSRIVWCYISVTRDLDGWHMCYEIDGDGIRDAVLVCGDDFCSYIHDSVWSVCPSLKLVVRLFCQSVRGMIRGCRQRRFIDKDKIINSE